MMRGITIISETIGLISSLLLAWGFSPPKGTVTWTTGDGSRAKRSARFLKLAASLGFLLLALSFGLKLYIILYSP